jgi:hypothetical protein
MSYVIITESKLKYELFVKKLNNLDIHIIQDFQKIPLLNSYNLLYLQDLGYIFVVLS